MRSLVTFRYHFLSKEWKDSGFVNQTHLSELSLYENAEAIHPQLVFGRGHGRLTLFCFQHRTGGHGERHFQCCHRCTAFFERLYGFGQHRELHAQLRARDRDGFDGGSAVSAG